MVSSKLALVLMLTAGGVVGRSANNIQRLDRLSRRGGAPGGQPGGQPGGFGNGGTDPLTHPAAPGAGSGGFGNGGTDPLSHPAPSSLGDSLSASKGGQMHWATDASGFTGGEMLKNLPKGFFIGTAIDNPDLNDPLVAPIIKNFGYVTPGNSLKMQFIYESENSWQELLTGVNKAVGKDDVKWKYHTVIWGAETSQKMMQQSFSKEAMMKTITDFVTTKMCPKIMKEADFWGIDVLNEVFADDGSGFKKNGYFEVIGEEGYKQVLKLVKKECPNYKLIVNDYGMESMNPKSNFAFKTIKQWLAEGVPVDVVGLQFHVQLENKYEDMLASIKRWTSEQIPVVLSEIDIPINLPPSQQDLEKQAQQYGNLMQAALEGGAFGATFWGHMDSHTWFGTQQEPGVGHGKTGAPLLFDAQGKPKQAVAAIVDVFKKWGSKQAGIEGGRASDLGKASPSGQVSGKGSKGSDKDDGSASSSTGAGEGYDGSSTGAGAGADTGAGAGAGAGSGAGAGAATGTGSDEGEDCGDGTDSGSGSGANSGSGSDSGSPEGYGSNDGSSSGSKDKPKHVAGSTPGAGSAPGTSNDSTGGSDGSAGSGSAANPGGDDSGDIDMGPPDTSAGGAGGAGTGGSGSGSGSSNGAGKAPGGGAPGSGGSNPGSNGSGAPPVGYSPGGGAGGAPEGYAPGGGAPEGYSPNGGAPGGAPGSNPWGGQGWPHGGKAPGAGGPPASPPVGAGGPHGGPPGPYVSGPPQGGDPVLLGKHRRSLRAVRRHRG